MNFQIVGVHHFLNKIIKEFFILYFDTAKHALFLIGFDDINHVEG